ncbi:MAG: hypothetical protein GOV02_03350 [Candidatus Aenigmarchaeota archaeon]|nr:hypothetical protein [Candidatus Aenigmarchaeota archaeon]
MVHVKDFLNIPDENIIFIFRNNEYIIRNDVGSTHEQRSTDTLYTIGRPGLVDYEEIGSVEGFTEFFESEIKKNANLRIFTADVGYLRCGRFPLESIGRMDDEEPEEGLQIYWQDDPLDKDDIEYFKELGITIEPIEFDGDKIHVDYYPK